MELNKIYNEDCLETMKKMEDNSIDLVVTSPPYDNLRTYNGYSFEFEKVAKELYRVTHEGGIVVWVVGDETSKFNESGTSFKQALYFKEIGFNLLDTMIYYKQNYAPAYPNLRRYANQFEYMFVFSKGRPKTFNPIQKPKVRNKREKASYRQKDGSLKIKIKEKGRETKDATNVWEFAVTGNRTGHPAVFPEQLANDHILSWSNEGDVVYDPFMGSGTTAKMALKNGRNYIGSEMSDEYYEIATDRIQYEIDNPYNEEKEERIEVNKNSQKFW
jgi:site-specific DNA-methyltransferase (adenine-specific)